MDHLLVISVECGAAPPATLRTVWATTGDVHAGHRRTDVELIGDEPALLQRLAALAPLLVPSAAVQEGSAMMVSDPVLAPAAGGGRRAA